MKAVNTLRRLCPMLLALGFGLPSAAQTTGASMSERIALNGAPQTTIGSKGTVLRVSESQGDPLAGNSGTSLQDSLNGTLPTARRSMLWAVHRSGVGVGFGVEQRDSLSNRGISQPVRSGAMLMGVSMDTGERSQVFMQTPLLNENNNNGSSFARGRADELPPGLDAQQRQIRMGLVFNTKSQVADLRKGLRMELSGQTTLTLKPRGGRIGVAFQKIW